MFLNTVFINIRCVLGFASILFVSSCGSIPINLQYYPHSLFQGNGEIVINKFKYNLVELNRYESAMPDRSNILRTTRGDLEIDEDFGLFLTNALLLEFKFAGYNIQKGNIELDGEIIEFVERTEDRESRWYLSIKYKLSNIGSNEPLYEKIINIDTSSDSYNYLPAFFTTIRKSFDQLFGDKEFLKAIKNRA